MWWDQEGISIKGERVAMLAAETVLEEEEESETEEGGEGGGGNWDRCRTLTRMG